YYSLEVLCYVSVWGSYRAITPFGWEAPVECLPWLGLLLGGGTSQCLSIPVNAASMRSTAYGWRNKPQPLQKRGRYKTRLMFASNLEANERVSDEWGRPKSKKHQTE